MLKSSEREIGLVRRGTDKLLRYFKGKYEGTKRVEIDNIIKLFKEKFSQLPEVFNLGNDYENRQELSKESFKLEYWNGQLKGHFYKHCEHMISSMCSYEISKMKAIVNDGYTDDPVHLLFYVIKEWLVKLSNTHFDQPDLDAAIKWQELIKSIIVMGVFKASNEDNRMQVLFKLEKILREEVIPELSQKLTNQCAYKHLNSLQGHLTMFFNHVFKYLFYVSRDSEYSPNFCYNKLVSIVGEELPGQNNFLTHHEKNAWGSLKDTLAIKLLHDLIKDELPLLTKATADASSQAIVVKNSDLSNTFYHENPNNMIAYLNLPVDYSKHKFASHIDLQAYVNTHLFLKEIIHFMKLFNSAQYCAEMGGNLLVYGVLGEQLITDITDCLNCLHIIFQNCMKIDADSWKAYQDKMYSTKDPLLNYVSKNWTENYSQSAVSYFNQLQKEYHLCRDALSNLASAACKKSEKELIKDTQDSVDDYKRLHEEHYKHRQNLLSHHNVLNYQLARKALGIPKPITINQLDTRNLFKKGIELYSQIDTIGSAKVYARAIVSRIKDESNPGLEDYYYASRFFSKFPDGGPRSRELLLKLVSKEETHLRANYRLALSFFEEKNTKMAKHHCDKAIRTAMSNGLEKFLDKKLLPLLKLIMEVNEDSNLIGGSNVL